MSLILCEEANQRTMRRLVKVLREMLPAEAEEVNDLPIPLPIPPAPCYFRMGTEEDMTRVLNGAGAGCFIVPSNPNVEQQGRTGSTTVHGRLDATEWRIIFLFKAPAGHVPFEVDGYEITQTEAVWELADRIRAAAQLVLFKHAPNQTDIHSLDVITTIADYIPLANAGLTGRAVLEVRVLQDVVVPQPRYTLP